MASPQVPNETESSVTRTTKDGRTLRYQMKVLQQPQRARACGSGAKSSADRRPVDPPPVVELKIFEGDSKNDITFSHNANFFLYTTLESARPIAPIRGNTIPPPYPVLTGTPVAGMAYLDRPVPAGYFIFPDLSVRHEGKYRLSFNLFEELKEDKDADPNSSLNAEHPNKQLLRSSPMAPHTHVHFRLEVKSEPFVVYSAKKFPGLAESTSLSRVVAEQGCRVRIRRDVRMRRRENKPASKDYDDFEDDGFSRAERFATPDAYSQAAIERARSVSNSSVDGTAHQYPAVDRRTTSHDGGFYNQSPYQQAPIQAQLSQHTNNFGHHLSFGNAPQYQAPNMPNNGLQTSGQPYNNNSSSSVFQHQQQQQPQHSAIHSRHGSNASIVEYSQQSYHPQAPFHAQQAFQDRSNTQVSPHPARDLSNYVAVDTKFMPNTQHYLPQPTSIDLRPTTPSNTTTQLLPPLKTIQPPLSAPMVASPSTTYDQPTNAYNFSPSQVAAKYATHGKRSFSTTFDSSHINNSISHGARPDANGQDILQIETEEDGLIDEVQVDHLKMLIYRRADGTKQHKKVPSPAF